MTDQIEPVQEPIVSSEVVVSAIMTAFLAKPLEEQTGEVVLEDGSKQTYKAGILDGVSILKDGTQVIYTDGILHSPSGVATIIYPNGDMHFYTDNMLMKVMLSDGTTLIGAEIP